ncbi:aspartate kinase [Marinigracilibium pacificum]|uniref:Aspartokinase n=1 Tax=Marinigracilibium pacificum TaxID=2729599 RepID=A0A848IQZ6_9BACT|nr:aspartate kinase [Marinigracilibium pacificum]NMM46883.1 aspartate kinase [Marinigracilibium pacificum]
MKILKFGGTSVGSPERMNQVASIISSDDEPKVVVLSAVSGTTNSLVQLGEYLKSGDKNSARTLVDELKAKYDAFVDELLQSDELKAKGKSIIDEHFTLLSSAINLSFNEGLSKELLAQGELISTKLFVELLNQKGLSGQWLNALDFMRINEDDEPDIPHIAQNFPIKDFTIPGGLYITQGFICKNEKGEVDNLKRGGSDYSASLIGAALEASEVQIWTDIDGMHNNDPRVVKKTVSISELSFNEAAELAYFGAKILHPASILPAQKYDVPVRLLNTMQPEARGTIITSKEQDTGIKAVAAKDGITAIKIKSTRMLLAYGFLRKIFEVFEKYKTPVDMITTSEVAVSLTIDDDTNLSKIKEELEPFGTIEIDTNQSIICLVGDFVSDRPGIVKQVFDSLTEIPVRMISYGGSRHNISVLINSQYKVNALQCLNRDVFQLEEV